MYSRGDLTVAASGFSANRALGDTPDPESSGGGALWAGGTGVSLTGSGLLDNSSSGDGGALVYRGDGSVNVVASTLARTRLFEVGRSQPRVHEE